VQVDPSEDDAGVAGCWGKNLNLNADIFELQLRQQRHALQLKSLPIVLADYLSGGTMNLEAIQGVETVHKQLRLHHRLIILGRRWSTPAQQ
jgi:hypothetical protein